MKKFCKTSLIKSSVYFTVATVIFSLLVLIGNSGADQISLDPLRVLWIYPFCLSFALANTLITYKNIDASVRWITHAVLTVCGAFLFLILPAGLETGSGNFMGFALITFAYVVGILLYALIHKRVRSAIAEDRKLVQKNNKK